MIGKAVICAALSASPAIAQIEPFLGARCSASEVMSIEEYGAGFNEHTVCDFTGIPVFKNGTMRVNADCANIYVTDMSTDPVTVVETDKRSIVLFLQQTNDIDIDLSIDGTPAGRFGACG